MKCPMRDMCEFETASCELDCDEFTAYQQKKIDEFRNAWKQAHPTLWRVYQVLLLLYLLISFLCVIQVFGWILQH